MAQLQPDQLIVSHQQAVLAIRARIETFVKVVWAGLGSYRDADIDRLIRIVVPRIQAGQLQVAQLTDAYLSRLAGRAARGVDPRDVTGTAVRGGADPAEVYRRPAATTYTALAEGKNYNTAIDLGLARLVSIAATDLQLAMRLQEQRSMAGLFPYYRRVITGRGCALCAIASTQRYHVGDLKPIHPGCHCTVAPGLANGDPGQVLNSGRLESIHDSVLEQLGQRSDRGARDLGIGKTDAQGRPLSDYTELIVTHEHGEYGPTLAWRGDHFTGPSGVAA